MSTLPKLIYRFHAIPINPSTFLNKWQKLTSDSKIYIEIQKVKIIPKNLESDIGELKQSHIKNYYKAMEIKTMQW